MKRGQAMVMLCILGLSLGIGSGCDAVRSLVGVDGTVYRCDVGVQFELCWRGAEAELADDLAARYGLPSVACSLSTRPATWFGCLYECPPPAHGCNALDSCFCPTP